MDRSNALKRDGLSRIETTEETTMKDFELMKLRAQRSILMDVAREYPGRTIENIIQNMDARIKNHEKQRKESKA